jgi:NAD(P)-dependent dehydrogenase (short-subunit alcohol dehydrogenase family)
MATSREFEWATTGREVVDAFADKVKGRTCKQFISYAFNPLFIHTVLTQNIVLITGPSTGGIGEETAYALSLAQPAALFLAGRNLSKVQPLIERIHATNPSVNVHFIQLALDDMESVRNAAAAILALNVPLDVIINNAGIMFCPFALTPQGIESQFGTNHIGHFLLTNLLLPAMRSGGRIVNVSSSGHYFSGIRFTDPNFTKGYDFADAYGQSKTANILHALSLAERLRDRNIKAFSVHPGSISTGLQVHITPESVAPAVARAKEIWPKEFVAATMGRERKSLEQGCSTQLVAALDPALEGMYPSLPSLDTAEPISTRLCKYIKYKQG